LDQHARVSESLVPISSDHSRSVSESSVQQNSIALGHSQVVSVSGICHSQSLSRKGKTNHHHRNDRFLYRISDHIKNRAIHTHIIQFLYRPTTQKPIFIKIMKYLQTLLIVSAIYSLSTLVQAEYDSRYPTGKGVRMMIISSSIESALNSSSVSLITVLLCVASSFVVHRKVKVAGWE
jgi:hypothetical protein